MSRYVIDTNVAIVANGSSVGVTDRCRLAAIEILLAALKNGVIFLDTEGKVQTEYGRHLKPRGQPGVGDRFYLEIINSNPKRVQRVDLLRKPNGEYVDLPQRVVDAGFDPSDRVFAALAKKTKSKVHNAVDTDWLEKLDVLQACGIKVVFVCGTDSQRWREAP